MSVGLRGGRKEGGQEINQHGSASSHILISLAHISARGILQCLPIGHTNFAGQPYLRRI